MEEYIEKRKLLSILNDVDEPTFDVALEIVEQSESIPVVPVACIEMIREEMQSYHDNATDEKQKIAFASCLRLFDKYTKGE